jgi:Uma2 family endonuclease
VKELWLVDPDTKTIHVYHLQKDPENPVVSYSARQMFASSHFPGLKISGQKVFKR